MTSVPSLLLVRDQPVGIGGVDDFSDGEQTLQALGGVMRSRWIG